MCVAGSTDRIGVRQGGLGEASAGGGGTVPVAGDTPIISPPGGWPSDRLFSKRAIGAHRMPPAPSSMQTFRSDAETQRPVLVLHTVPLVQAL